jgi:hypothetical protein
VAAGPAALAGRHLWWRVGVEAAPRPQPHQDRGGRVGQPQRQAGGVVAGVEHKQRHLPASGQAVQQRADLGDGDLVVVVEWVQAAGVHRRGPAVAMKAELGVHW